MKIENFIQKLIEIVDHLKLFFLNKFQETPEEFKSCYVTTKIKYYPPEKIKEANEYIKAIEAMQSRLITAQKIKDHLEVSENEIYSLLEIEASKECEEITQVASTFGLSRQGFKI